MKKNPNVFVNASNAIVTANIRKSDDTEKNIFERNKWLSD